METGKIIKKENPPLKSIIFYENTFKICNTNSGLTVHSVGHNPVDARNLCKVSCFCYFVVYCFTKCTTVCQLTKCLRCIFILLINTRSQVE